MFNPALIERYRFSAMRPSRIWIFLTVYIMSLVLMVIVDIVLFVFNHNFHSMSELFRALYAELLMADMAILWIWTGYGTATAIKDERASRTLDFFRLLPLTPHEKAVGILVGRNLTPLLFGAITLPITVGCGALGGADVSFQWQILTLLLTVAVLVNTVSLLSALSSTSTKTATARTHPIILAAFILLMLATVFPFSMAIFESSTTAEISRLHVQFLYTKLPIVVLGALLALYFAAWAYLGVVRKLRVEDAEVFTVKGALLFTAGFGVVLFGIFENFSTGPTPANAFYWILMAVPTVVISLATAKPHARYLEHLGQRQEASGKTAVHLRHLLACSNLSLGLMLFALWLVFALQMTFRVGLPIDRHLRLAGAAFSFYLFYWSLLELYVLYKSRQSRIGLLLGFVAAVFLVLPLVLAGIADTEALALHSPLGAAALLFDAHEHRLDGYLGIVILSNLTISAVSVALVFKQYRHLIAIRNKMSATRAR